MFSDAEMHTLHERVFEAMLRAGWLHSFTFTTEKGWWRNWTPLGVERIGMLRGLVTDYGLTDDDRLPHAFGVIAKGGAFPGLAMTGEPDEMDRDFYALCMDELGLSGADELLVLAHISTWD